jgi:hypothetical protein
MKARDAGSAHLLIVVADTHRNRAAMREVAPLVTEMFPVDARHALAALRAGRYPGGSAIILL